MTEPDPAQELLMLHLRNLHELIRTVDLRLRRIEVALGLMAETGRLEPLGSMRPGPDTLRHARREGFLTRLVGVVDRRPGQTALGKRLRRGWEGREVANDPEVPPDGSAA